MIEETAVIGDTSFSRARETFVVKPTGNKVDCPVVAEHRWKEGKIVFWREYFCQAEFLDALGLVEDVTPKGP